MTTIIFRPLLLVGVALLLATGCSRDAKRAKYRKQAETHFRAGDYDRAEIEYRNLLRLERNDGVALRNLGLIAFEQGRSLHAYGLLSAARKASPEDLEVRVRLAQILLSGGKPKEAREEAVLLLARQPADENTLMLLVESSLGTAELKDAEQRLAGVKPGSDQTAGYHVARAVLHLRQGDLKAAEASIRHALSLDPKSSLAHGTMADLHILNRDPTHAAAAFKAAADLAPPRSAHRIRYVDFKIAMGELDEAKGVLDQMTKQTPDYLPVLMRAAKIALAERRFPECETALKSVLVRDPVHLDGMLLQARFHLVQNRPDEAVLVLKRALQVFPRLPQIHYQVAAANLSQNDLAAAAKSLNQALAIQPDYPEAIMLLAELNIRRGDTSEAIGSLTRLAERRPDLISAKFLLATAYRGATKLEPALQIYQELSRTSPADPQPAFMTGLVERQMNKNAEARRSFERVLTFAPGFLAAVEQLVSLDLAENHFPAALQRAQAQVEHTPANPAAYVLLAGVQFAEPNLASAEATLRKALALAPDHRAANALLSRIYVASKQYPAALTTLNEIVARDPKDLASWLKIAELHAAASNYSAAKEAYEKALDVNPSYVPALNNLAWLSALRLGDLERAYELGSKAHNLSPGDPLTSDTLGWVLYLMRDYPRALALIRESANALPQEPEVQFHLGMAHYMMGEEAPARVALQNAIQLASEGDWRNDATQRLGLLDLVPAAADAQTEAELDALAARSAGDPILLLRQAAVAEKKGEWGKAAEGYAKALQINPKLVSAMVKFSQLLATKLDDGQKAIELARRARQASADDPRLAHTLGQIAYAAGDFPWAASLLRESVGRLPDDPEVQLDFGLAAYSLGQVSNATAAVRKALESGLPVPRSEQAKTLLQMASLLGDPKQADAASAQVQELVTQQPDHAPALMVMAGIQERKGNFADARDSYTRILKLLPAFAPAHRQLAFLYSTGLKSPSEAYAHAQKAREAFPEDHEVARLLGMIAYRRGDFARAGPLLQAASLRFPDDSDVLYCLGLTQEKSKQSRDCKTNLTKALARAPNSEFAADARRVLAELK